jgi:hypothetical protein
MRSDQVVELADRARAMPDWQFQFAFACLTRAQRREFLVLMDQRRAHAEERREAIAEENRILRLLIAYKRGSLTAMEFVDRVRGVVPDPLSG